MFCPKCGTQNDDPAVTCSHCGQTLQSTPAGLAQNAASGGMPATQNIPNYLVHSILVTLLCCLPFGIAAIVYAAQVNSKAQAGDIDGALQSSKKAKQFVWISFWLGLVWMLFSAISFGASLFKLIPLIKEGSF